MPRRHKSVEAPASVVDLSNPVLGRGEVRMAMWGAGCGILVYTPVSETTDVAEDATLASQGLG
ncbi:MAG: hypothetical protein R3C68_03015 [Myxococcota bacterium]